MTLRVALVLAALLPAAVFAQAPPGGAPAVPDQGAPAAPQWLPQPIVRLIALDKITARPTPLSGKVGQEMHFGSLTIVARSCFVRPPDAPEDATAFLDITDQHRDVEPFHAWMFANEPSITIYQNPVYDIRLAGCANAP